MSDSFGRSRSRPTRRIWCQQASGVIDKGGGEEGHGGGRAPTLLAGFVLSFSKILSDCCLVARPLMVTVFFGDFVCW